jgi:hypothetical protein
VGCVEPQARQLPRRMELHAATNPAQKVVTLF